MEFNVNPWQDRQLNDDALYQQFLSLWQNDQFQGALNLLNNNAQHKEFVAAVLNIGVDISSNKLF